MNRPTRNTPDGDAYLDIQKLAKADGRATDELLALYALEGFLDRSAPALVRDIAAVHKDDGLVYDAGSATAEVIRDEEEYSGVRVRLIGHLSRARIPFHVDVNVGDPIVPPARTGRGASPSPGIHHRAWVPAIHGVCRKDRHGGSTRDGQHSLA